MLPTYNRLSHSVTFQCVIWRTVTCLKCPTVRTVRAWFWKTPGNVSPNMSVVGHSLILCDVQSLFCSSTHTQTYNRAGTRVISLTRLSSFLFSALQSAKRKSALFKLPPTVPRIGDCRSKRPNAVMCLNACAAARTLPTPAPLASLRPPQPTTVAAQKPAACQTRRVCVWMRLSAQKFPFLCLSSFKLSCLSRCAWSVGWFTQWGVNGRMDVRSALAPSCRTERHRCTLLSAPSLSAIGTALGWDTDNTRNKRTQLYYASIANNSNVFVIYFRAQCTVHQ